MPEPNDQLRADPNRPEDARQALYAEAASRWLAGAVAGPRPTGAPADETVDWLAADPAHAEAWDLAARAWALAGRAGASAAGSADGGSADGGSALAARRDTATADLPLLPMRSAPRPRRWLVGIAAAALAACLLIAVLPRVLLAVEADYRTGIGETLSQYLADGSQVTLDTDSALATAFTPETRRVALLRGRAFFEVTADRARPFVVGAGDATVTVTGTAFAVALDGGTVDVAVASGHVRVAAGGTALTLAPGDRVTIAGAGAAVSRGHLAPDSVAAWRRHLLIVDNAPLGDAVAEIARYAPGAVLITDPALAVRRVTGVYDLDDPARALRAVLEPHGGRITAWTPWLTLIAGPEDAR
jgi:transmembrane sensor